jgi:hypothetical protein
VYPFLDILPHKLMLSGDRGAAAVLGATTLAGVDSNLALGQRFLHRALTPGLPIGKGLVQAKQELAAAAPGMIDVIAGWTILGDPGLVVRPSEVP